jgi:hypothetical protein
LQNTSWKNQTMQKSWLMSMTREDVIRIALEVGFYDGEVNKCQLMLERFAYLIAQQERERIAKKIEQLPFGDTAASFGVYVREA